MMVTFDQTIPFCVDEEYTSLGIRKPLDFSCLKQDGQRILICGPSGSGKTVLTASLLGKISLYMPGTILFLVDYKGIDYTYCEDCRNYYAVDHALDGIHQFFTLFENRLAKRIPCDSFAVLMIDEFPSLLMSLPKKDQEEVKTKLARMLNLSRAFKIHIIMAMQRPSADLFANGARDNYNHRFLMGAMANNRESVSMVANEFKDQIEPCPVGIGYYISDTGIKKIRSLLPRNTEKLHSLIRKAVHTPPQSVATP